MRSSSLVLSALLVLFCVGSALAADAVFTHLINTGVSAGASRMGRLINQVRDPKEIPIFGASKAGENYLPEVLGPDYYNYGFAAASPDVTNLLVSFELERKSTQPIVIDLHQTPYYHIGDVRNFLPFARRPKVKALLRKNKLWRWYYGVPGLRYFGAYDWYLKDVLTDQFPVNRKVVRGYSNVLNRPPWSRKAFERDVARRLRISVEFGMDESQRQEMLSLIRSAPGRRFIIVLSPLHKSYLQNATGEDAYRAKLAEFQALPNVQLLDFTRVDYPDQYYRDPGHLRPEGAKVFSTQLKAAIEAGASSPKPGA